MPFVEISSTTLQSSKRYVSAYSCDCETIEKISVLVRPEYHRFVGSMNVENNNGTSEKMNKVLFLKFPTSELNLRLDFLNLCGSRTNICPIHKYAPNSILITKKVTVDQIEYHRPEDRHFKRVIGRNDQTGGSNSVPQYLTLTQVSPKICYKFLSISSRNWCFFVLPLALQGTRLPCRR
jgi:hypothetical protein